MNWEVFGSVGSWVSGIATFLAVLVSLFQIRYENRKKVKLLVWTDQSTKIETFIFRAINKGRRSVRIDNWGIAIKADKPVLHESILKIPPEICVPNNLPCVLKIDDAITMKFDLKYMQKYIQVHKRDIGKGHIVFYVSDTTGQKYKTRSKYTVDSFLKIS